MKNLRFYRIEKLESGSELKESYILLRELYLFVRFSKAVT